MRTSRTWTSGKTTRNITRKTKKRLKRILTRTWLRNSTSLLEMKMGMMRAMRRTKTTTTTRVKKRTMTKMTKKSRLRNFSMRKYVI